MDPHTWRVGACRAAVGALVLVVVLAAAARAVEAQALDGATFAFREETVVVGEEPWEVEGSLVVPEGAGRFPGVVLVPGFGPFDRDATTGLDKPFRDLAHGLAERGIASIRFDKRTLIHGPKMDGKSLTVEEDLILDALAAARLLREEEGLGALFIVGHGLGATLAPEIAQRAQASGAVMLAALVTPLDELVLRQLEEAFQSGGLTLEEESHLERARAAVDQFRQGQTEPAQTYLGPAKYFVDLRERDPVAQAEGYPGPLLILHGSRDQVVPASELTLWRERLGFRPNVTSRLFPFLNHTFTRGSESVLSSGFRWRREMAPEVIETIASWILARAPVEVAPVPEALAPPGGPDGAPPVGDGAGQTEALPEDGNEAVRALGLMPGA